MSDLVSIGEVCGLQNGRAFKPEEWSESGTPIIRIQNLNDEAKPFNYCNFDVEKRFHVHSGDLLFSWSGTPGTSFGAFFWNRGRGFLNQHIFRVDVDERRILKSYLRRALNSKLNLIMAQAHGGVGLQHITKGKLEAVEIPLPSLEEQRRIAAILDKADALRAKRREALAQLDRLAQAIFVEMFGDPATNPMGWPRATLGDLVQSVSDGPHVSPVYADSGVPFLSARHVRPREIKWSDLKYIDIDEAKVQWRKCRPMRGDILYTKGGTTGFAAEVKTTDPFAVWVHVALVRPNFEKCNSTWLEVMLNSEFCYRQSQELTHGVANKDLGLKRMVRIVMYCPPLDLQDEFVARIRQLDSMRSVGANAVDMLDSLFLSLQHRAFQGEL